MFAEEGAGVLFLQAGVVNVAALFRGCRFECYGAAG